jgi:hypothetical protein
LLHDASTSSDGGSPSVDADGDSFPSDGTVPSDANLPVDSSAGQDADAGILQALNYAFVTSTTAIPGELNQVEGAADGLDGADILCNRAASAAGLPGTYVAWLSNSKVNAVDRLAGARGWQRTDGVPFADQYHSLRHGANWVPLNRDEYGQSVNRDEDEYGQSVGRLFVFTGTNGNGARDTRTCDDWSSTRNIAVGGALGDVGISWTSTKSPRCNTGHRLYCFGVDQVQVAAPPQGAGRYAFVSQASFVPGTGRDVLSADELCQHEASEADLPGMYKAFLATTGASALSRFDIDGPWWVRRDGVPFGGLGDLVDGRLLTAIHTHADGSYAEGQIVFSGASRPEQVGTWADTCGNWGSSEGVGLAGVLPSTSWPFSGLRRSCVAGAPVYCFQE